MQRRMNSMVHGVCVCVLGGEEEGKGYVQTWWSTEFEQPMQMQFQMVGTIPPSPSSSLSPLSHLLLDLLLLRPIHPNRQTIMLMKIKYGFIVYCSVKCMTVLLDTLGTSTNRV